MEHLKELRKAHKLTQQDVATYLGIHRSTYTKYENGQSEPPFETITQLASFYDVSTDYLLDYQRRPQKNTSKEQSFHLSDDEKDLILSYRNLNTAAKNTFMAFARSFLNDPANKKEPPQTGTA